MAVIGGRRLLVLANSHQEIAAFIVPDSGPIVRIEPDAFDAFIAAGRSIKTLPK